MFCCGCFRKRDEGRLCRLCRRWRRCGCGRGANTPGRGLRELLEGGSIAGILGSQEPFPEVLVRVVPCADRRVEVDASLASVSEVPVTGGVLSLAIRSHLQGGQGRGCERGVPAPFLFVPQTKLDSKAASSFGVFWRVSGGEGGGGGRCAHCEIELCRAWVWEQ